MTAGEWIQAILVTLLVVVTAYYAWQAKCTSDDTKRLAQAAKQQADASVKMAEEMREQRYGRYRPIVIIRDSASITGRDGYEVIEAMISNVGNGPAMKLALWLETNERTLYPYPLVKEEIIDTSGEFAHLIETAEYSTHAISLGEGILLNSGSSRRFGFYWTDSRERGAVIPLGVKGVFVAKYVDVVGREFRSTLPVELLQWKVRVGPFCVDQGTDVPS